MKGIGTIIILIVSFAFIHSIKAQSPEIHELFLKFDKLYASGDLNEAEECMLKILEFKDSLPLDYLIPLYNNLGTLSTSLGKYEKSLECFDQAEVLIGNNQQFLRILGIIYSNKARTYNLQKLFSYSIEFLEKSVRIYQEMNNPDKGVLFSLSLAYQNLAVSYQGLNDFKTALEYLEMSADLRFKYNLPRKALIYLNIANIYVKTGDSLKAEKSFLRSIQEFKSEFGEGYYRLADVYFDYGLFLRSIGRGKEALEYHTKALSICLKNFGKKHPDVSLAYKYIGDHYTDQSDYPTALQYYQKALIAIVSDFDNPDINTNPSLDSSLSDIDYLKILQKKSEVLAQLSDQQKNRELSRQTMAKSLETIELALKLIDRIRNDYMTEESRLYLMDNEKESYISAARITRSLYTLTGDPAFLRKMYTIARQAKSAILHNEITDNKLFYSIGIPDTLVQEHESLLRNIAAYNNLIHEELKNTHPDNKKTNSWKDALFEMKRAKENMEERINRLFPQYQDLLRKTGPVSLEEIQKHLKQDESLIEYLVSNKYTGGRRQFYIFTVTRDSLNFQESFLDTLFMNKLEIIKQNNLQLQSGSDKLARYKKYTGALFDMYENLIKPVENHLAGKKLIIIPDEEIAFLPFDAFIRNKSLTNYEDYEGLQYLIKTYTISFGYSSSLVFNNDKEKTRSLKVNAFSPDYPDYRRIPGKGLDTLEQTRAEIDAIYKQFNGEKFLGVQATENNFKSQLQNPAIFHLAMHSVMDKGNSRYSCLIFDSHKDTVEDGKLYDYEISLSRIKSPMVVLSACNTGMGTLQHGEGVMSITRAFILAGASSVIKTLWDVNDQASSRIICSFYDQLSRGKDKDEALRFAKLEYLKTSRPAFKNPCYWAAYQVVGDKSSVVKSNRTWLYLLILAVLILGAGIRIFYFRWRRSFLA